MGNMHTATSLKTYFSFSQKESKRLLLILVAVKPLLLERPLSSNHVPALKDHTFPASIPEYQYNQTYE